MCVGVWIKDWTVFRWICNDCVHHVARRHLAVALISSPSSLYLRRSQRKAATNYGLVDRRMPRESNQAGRIASPASGQLHYAATLKHRAYFAPFGHNAHRCTQTYTAISTQLAAYTTAFYLLHDLQCIKRYKSKTENTWYNMRPTQQLLS